MTRRYRHGAPAPKADTRPLKKRSNPRRIRYKVAPANEMPPGESRKFLLTIQGVDEECFLINYEGKFHAYVNRCRHVPIAMDWVDNQFFADVCFAFLPGSVFLSLGLGSAFSGSAEVP